MSEQTAQEAAYGRFVWHDLMTTDLESAKAFYGELLGWDVREVPMGEGPDGPNTYSMIFASAAEDAPGVGGFETLRAPGIPAHWLGYVEVENVDAVAGRAAEAGGAVAAAPTDIPTVGRFCVIRDPEGGCLAPFQSAGERGPDPAPGSLLDGQFVWNELLARDTERCGEFYPQVMPWKHEAVEMAGPDGSPGTYHMWMRPSGEGCAEYFDAGMLPMPETVPGEVPAHWMHYVQVGDVDATVEKARELGATVHCAPTDIPNIGRFAVLADLQGAAFAVFKSAPKPDAS